MRRFPTLLIACSSAVLMSAALAVETTPTMSSTAPNAAGSQEINMAASHAEHAIAGKSVKEIHSHLQHVVNCLVGPGGKGFKSSAENPCSGMGKGALNDVDQRSNEQHELMEALTAAKDGLKKNDVHSAHKEANDVLNDLQKAQATYGGSGATSGVPAASTHK